MSDSRRVVPIGESARLTMEKDGHDIVLVLSHFHWGCSKYVFSQLDAEALGEAILNYVSDHATAEHPPEPVEVWKEDKE